MDEKLDETARNSLLPEDVYTSVVAVLRYVLACEACEDFEEGLVIHSRCSASVSERVLRLALFLEVSGGVEVLIGRPIATYRRVRHLGFLGLLFGIILLSTCIESASPPPASSCVSELVSFCSLLARRVFRASIRATRFSILWLTTPQKLYIPALFTRFDELLMLSPPPRPQP